MDEKVIELPKRFQQGAVVMQQRHHHSRMVERVAPSRRGAEKIAFRSSVRPTPCHAQNARHVPGRVLVARPLDNDSR